MEYLNKQGRGGLSEQKPGPTQFRGEGSVFSDRAQSQG